MRFVWFDLVLLDPVIVAQSVGRVPLLNLATIHAALVAFWLWLQGSGRRSRAATMVAVIIAVAVTVRQAIHGEILIGGISRTENWLYSASFLGLALFWLGLGMRTDQGNLRVTGLALLALVTVKVFLIDAAALEGILRIFSLLSLGIALVVIGWAYGRFVAVQSRST